MNYQQSRRYFLKSSAAVTLLQLLGGCARGQTASQILLLENSIPPQLIRNFRKSLTSNNQVEFKPQTNIPQIFDSLFSLQHSKNSDGEIKKVIGKIFNKSENYPSLSTLGDAWLSTAIKQNLIQPLSIKSLANWKNVPASWQNLVRRNNRGDLADEGAVYGAPYRWGSTVIAYRQDKLEPLNITLQDWQDLWQPELRDRLSLLDSPREIIGLTLKKLGQSYNTENLDSVANLSAELLALQQQTKLYSSDRYLEPLVLGDTWVAVAWSTDILSLQKSYPEIKFIIPKSGTSRWADLWVRPQLPKAVLVQNDSSNNKSDAAYQWIDYCWQPETAQQISQFTDGVSPIMETLKSDISQKLQNNAFVNSEILNSDKSEFLLPLKPETEQQYRDLWIETRQSSNSESKVDG